jgi:hypothetical protein
MKKTVCQTIPGYSEEQPCSFVSENAELRAKLAETERGERELEDALVVVLKENCPDVVFRTCFNGEIGALRLLENRGLFKITGESNLGITGESNLGITGRFIARTEEPVEKPTGCVWRQEDFKKHGHWLSGCGMYWSDGEEGMSPMYRRFKFCPYCGEKIVIEPEEREEKACSL